MPAIIVDPYNYDKNLAWVEAVSHVKLFLQHNNVNEPTINSCAPKHTLNKWQGYGLYVNGNIHVNLKRAKTPVKTPGFSWTYTGYKADLTCAGILAHETGHYVHDVLGKAADAFLQIVGDEPSVSSYEPTVGESIAEAFKLFILNPSLLREGRPRRAKFFDETNLSPVVDVHWREVLRHAHPKLINAAEKWITHPKQC